MNATSPFPCWCLDESRAWLWVVPMAAANTRLQYGRFKGLSLQSLRPIRDAERKPVTTCTHDGKVRGLVQTMRGYRHIDVTAEHGMGSLVHLHPWPRPIAGREENWHNYALSQLPCRVMAVRAVRLRALIAEPGGGAPWVPYRAPVEQAVTDWDEMLEAIFKLVPTRHRAQYNPWLWCHVVELAP